MSDDHAAAKAKRGLLLRAFERAVELTNTLEILRRPRLTLKVKRVVTQAWLEGYAEAEDDLKAHMKGTEHDRQSDGR